MSARMVLNWAHNIDTFAGPKSVGPHRSLTVTDMTQDGSPILLSRFDLVSLPDGTARSVAR